MRTARFKAVWVVQCALVLGLATAAGAQERRHEHQPVRGGAPDGRLESIERLTERLADELDHLHEDLQYESVGRGILGDAERALEAVAHFQQVLQRDADRQHLIRDYRTMDRQLHQLLDQLSGSRAPWIQRAVARVQYADEQLHYHLQVQNVSDGETFRELVARHAHVLEQEAKEMEQFLRRPSRQVQGDPIYHAMAAFAREAEHFHQVVERGADRAHLREDFGRLDRAWHEAVDEINRSSAGMWLRRTAQRVNVVHNQLHAVIEGDAGREPTRDHVHREQRPRIEFEIPGIGRFQLRN